MTNRTLQDFHININDINMHVHACEINETIVYNYGESWMDLTIKLCTTEDNFLEIELLRNIDHDISVTIGEESYIMRNASIEIAIDDVDYMSTNPRFITMILKSSNFSMAYRRHVPFRKVTKQIKDWYNNGF